MKKMVTAAMLAGVGAPNALSIEAGESFPAIEINHHKKQEALNPEALKGKVTLVNFWATWCEACKVELGEFEDQLKPYLKDEAFQAAFISLDKEPEKAVNWFQSNMKDPKNYLERLFVDPKFAAAKTLEVDSFPMTLVIGPDGKIAHVQRGFKEGEGTTEKLVELAADLLKSASK